MRAWVQRSQDVGGVPVGFQEAAGGEPSIGVVDFELVVHPQAHTELKPCRDQAAMIADDTSFVSTNNITAVFLADCFMLDYADVVITDDITAAAGKESGANALDCELHVLSSPSTP